MITLRHPFYIQHRLGLRSFYIRKIYFGSIFVGLFFGVKRLFDSKRSLEERLSICHCLFILLQVLLSSLFTYRSVFLFLNSMRNNNKQFHMNDSLCFLDGSLLVFLFFLQLFEKSKESFISSTLLNILHLK